MPMMSERRMGYCLHRYGYGLVQLSFLHRHQRDCICCGYNSSAFRPQERNSAAMVEALTEWAAAESIGMGN